jgi:hypothetical protein
MMLPRLIIRDLGIYFRREERWEEVGHFSGFFKA